MLVIFATVQIWYLTSGQPQHDVARARRRAPWNVRKCESSFADMLAAARREILFPSLFDAPHATTWCVEIDPDLVELLLAA